LDYFFKPDNSIDNANISYYLDGNSNAKLHFISEPLATSNVGSPYVFDIYAANPDDDNLTITAITIPSWITVSPVTRLGSIHTKVSLTGTPTTIGNYPVEIIVSDGSRTDTLNYTLVVDANFDGEWILAGDAGFTDIENNMGIAVDTNGVIYALIGNNTICNVFRKAPDSSWTNFGNLNATGTKGHIRIGSAGFTNGVGSDCSIASHDNTPYVLYKDTTAINKASVRYYYIEPSSVAVENFTNNNNLTIYPNPATNQITIKVNETSDNFGKIYIYNMFGSLIQTEEINQNLQQINTSNLSNGIYLITYENNGLKQNQKLLIQK
jgi:hypothetical protein